MKDLSLYEKMDAQKNNFPIKLLSPRRATSLIPHWHEHFEFLFFEQGHCNAFCDGKRFPVGPGDLIVVNSTQVHSFTAENPVDFRALIVSQDLLQDIEYAGTVLQNKIPADPFVKECFAALEREYSHKRPGSDLLIKSYVYALFAHLVFHYTDRKTAAERPLQLERLDRVFQYISENYAEQIVPKTLAELLFVTESYFCRFFKSATGVTLSHYLIEYRIKKAMLLLEETDEPVARIAESVGINDANYFSRIFRKTVGMTPVSCRKTAKEQKIQL